MPIQHTTNQYLISRGRVYFDPYDASEQLTGEIDLGNCPGLSITINTEKKDHFSSQTGLRQKDATWLLQVDRTGTLSCDNFSPANASLWLAGQVETKTQAATPVTGELRGVLPGRQYQLGATAANPLGVRNVSAVTVKNEASTTTYAAGTDYNVDLETGRVLGDIVDGEAKKQHLLRLCARIGCDPSQSIAVGDGANDLLMMGVSGLSVAYHAKPKVREQAMVAINDGGLDRVLELLA